MITFPNAKINLGPRSVRTDITTSKPYSTPSLSKMRWKSGPAPKRTKSSPCISTEWRYPVIRKTI